MALSTMEAFVSEVMFLITLFLGQLLFTGTFARKEHFAARVVLSLFLESAAGFLLYGLFHASGSWLLYQPVYYLLLFVLSFLALSAFSEKPGKLVSCGVLGYLCQHIASQITQSVWPLLAGTKYRNAWFFVLQIAAYSAVYALLYVLVARRMTWTDLSKETERKLNALLAVSLIAVTLLSGARDAFQDESYVLTLVSRCFSVLCCLLLLYLRAVILEQNTLEMERKEMERVHALEVKQLQESRENIDLINLKCHDLRYRIEVWENSGKQGDAAELSQVKDLINIYDSTLHTGNETLDVILTQKSLYCEQHGIRLTCMADGEKLGFLPEGDICSLFGNALENAIEAAGKVKDKDSRLISFSLHESRGMLVAQVENCYEGELTLDAEGLPATSKTDSPGFHGYGMKSMLLTAQKAGGQMLVKADRDAHLFRVTVLLPLP
ncbi:MAG: ATP-binding protein [Lachnospiraceae bacterium]